MMVNNIYNGFRFEDSGSTDNDRSLVAPLGIGGVGTGSAIFSYPGPLRDSHLHNRPHEPAERAGYHLAVSGLLRRRTIVESRSVKLYLCPPDVVFRGLRHLPRAPVAGAGRAAAQVNLPSILRRRRRSA
jgi:hypothetical protein